MNAPTTLKAGEQGPIELTFFLSSPLPPLTSVILLTLTPALPTPSGVLKCYFLSTAPAPCSVQNTGTYTAFTINPPS